MFRSFSKIPYIFDISMLTQFHHIYTSMMKITTTITLKRKEKKKKDYMSHVKVIYIDIDEYITEYTYQKWNL